MKHKPPGTCEPASSIIRCWQMVNQCYDLLKEMIAQVFKDDPSLIPYPPAVTDGSPAPPGTVGEVIFNEFTGAWEGVATGGTAFNGLFLTTLSPGDWEISYSLRIAGAQVLSAYCQLDPTSGSVPTDIPSNLLAYGICTAGNFQGPAPMPALPIVCPPIPYNSAVGIVLLFQVVGFSGIGLAANATYTFDLWARRVR